MKKVYVFFADGFEEIEAMAPVDILRRAGMQVVMVSVTDDEIVKGAHGVSMFCDKNIVNCQIWITIIFREYVLQCLILCFDCPHSSINNCAYFRRMSRTGNCIPSCFFRNKENAQNQK